MRAAVIPTTGRSDLDDAVKAISEQVDHVILIAHNCPEIHDREASNLHVIPYTDDIPNISVMWNLGLELSQYLGTETTAILNDDAIVYRNWYDRIELAMRQHKAAGGWSSGRHQGVNLYLRPEPTLIRMTGYAFVMKSAFRADDQFQWWYGDNDLEWRLRRNGGVVQVGGDIVHRHPNGYTNANKRLGAISRLDAERFRSKWGMLP